MANGVANIARGKIGYYGGPGIDGAANGAFVIVVLEAAEVDDTLNNYDDLAALLAAAGNTEATSTGYARKTHAAADVTFTPDDTANTAKVVIGTDDTWTAVSQAATESWVKLLVCYDADTTAGTDANIIPLTHHDFAVTPNGGDITADYDQTNGIWSSA